MLHIHEISLMRMALVVQYSNQYENQLNTPHSLFWHNIVTTIIVTDIIFVR